MKKCGQIWHSLIIEVWNVTEVEIDIDFLLSIIWMSSEK